MVFVGYEHGSKAYRFFDPTTRRVVFSRDAVFDEAAEWKWDDLVDNTAPSQEPFTVEYSTESILVAPGTQDESTTPPSAASPQAPAPVEATPAPAEPEAPSPWALEYCSPPPEYEQNLDIDHDDDAPLRFRVIDNILGPTASPVLAERNIDAELHFTTAEEPSSFAEAEVEGCWRAAMIEEMNAINDNATWDLIELPRGQRAIGLKWVFKVKRDELGNIVRHKARLVAKGYVQKAGIDYNEVFTPVARMESVRLMLALAAHHGWQVHHMDVKSAFLNGELKEEVYVKQPLGFVVEGEEHKVLQLRKALYGLKQAARAWNAKFDTTMLSLGFQRSSAEHGVYTRARGLSRLIVGVYVDDLVITGHNVTDITSFKSEMKQLFRMSDLGLLSYYLGIEVHQGHDGITLRQAAYATKLLERSGMQDCNSALSPMETRLKLSKDSDSPTVNATEYRRIIGGLRYLVHTRPDLAFAVGYLSRFMEKPHEVHLAAVKRLLRYVAGTRGHGLHYAKQEGAVRLIGYSDADMAGDIDTRKSTTSIIFFLGTSPITWQSTKQKVVALSSCEAEYIAAAIAACQGVWLARLLHDLIGAESEAPKLKVDNQAAIALSRNPVFHDRSKHIETKYHYIRDCVDGGRIKIGHVSTDRQLADILTKALGRVRFQELRVMIGVHNLDSV